MLNDKAVFVVGIVRPSQADLNAGYRFGDQFRRCCRRCLRRDTGLIGISTFADAIKGANDVVIGRAIAQAAIGIGGCGDARLNSGVGATAGATALDAVAKRAGTRRPRQGRLRVAGYRCEIKWCFRTCRAGFGDRIGAFNAGIDC